MAPTPKASRNELPCEDPRCNTRTLRTSYCSHCDSSFCNVCWDQQVAHSSQKHKGGIPHEKSHLDVVETLRSILNPPRSDEDKATLHKRDEDTTWFGIIQERVWDELVGKWKEVQTFRDYMRYEALMADSSRNFENGDIYPQLVSFVGETSEQSSSLLHWQNADNADAGKSTLINMLLSMDGKTGNVSMHTNFPGPVVGSLSGSDDKVPTSGDVHMYADPSTYATQYPVLFADCEGLNGGLKEPLAVQIRERAAREARNRDRAHKFGKLIAGNLRSLDWANQSKSGREFAVTQFYPRLLYTFSNVVIFVSQNPKAVESSVVSLLLDWAATCLESSLNQVTIPTAIIVFNKTDLKVDESEWDVEQATRRLMDVIKDDVRTNPAFREAARFWSKEKGLEIKTTEELLKRYYSSIKVVRIPAEGRYPLLQQQIFKLRKQISTACDEAFFAKRRFNMLFNADELGNYLQAGFDHFSKKLDKPFNFLEVNARNNPLPKNLSDHIKNVAGDAFQGGLERDGARLFGALSPFLASCIQLEQIRLKRHGSAQDLFDAYFIQLCRAGLEKFCDSYWPCEWQDVKGRPCLNAKAAHTYKGHQTEDGTITVGKYVSNFSAEKFGDRWIGMIKKRLDEIDHAFHERMLQISASQKLTPRLTAEEAFSFHKKQVSKFFQNSKGRCESLLTCYCCLMEIPRHPLPCGHAVCTACVRSLGQATSDMTVSLDRCPLHESQAFNPSWTVYFKPDFAGVRILSLDGGGIRGIISLQVLAAIQNEIGGEIPIAKFFDLIVGTSAGGISTLGLGVKGWPVERCLNAFIATCDQAFTGRELKGVYGIGKAVALAKGSIYKPAPMYKALKGSLGTQHLFGGQQLSSEVYQKKVAVMATSGTGKRAIALTNYSRQGDDNLSWDLKFSENARPGLLVWEAAAATSAAPLFFKPFRSQNSLDDRTYLDGALYYNNPSKVAHYERRAIWPDTAKNHPDILLSLGTGLDRAKIEQSIEAGLKTERPSSQRHQAKKIGKASYEEAQGLSGLSAWALQRVKRPFNVLVNRSDNILDAELAWREFKNDALALENASDVGDRYIRINPDLRENPPRLDAKEMIHVVRDLARQDLERHESVSLVRKVARTLIASTFYFVKESLVRNDGRAGFTCTGRISCRFKDSSLELRSLGRFLQNHQSPTFQPSIQINGNGETGAEVRQVEISQEVVAKMVNQATFELAAITINVQDERSPTKMFLVLSNGSNRGSMYPLSGFPRNFVDENNHQGRPGSFSQQPSKVLSNRQASQSSLALSDSSTPSTGRLSLPNSEKAQPSARSENLHVTRSSSSIVQTEMPAPQDEADTELIKAQIQISTLELDSGKGADWSSEVIPDDIPVELDDDRDDDNAMWLDDEATL